MLDKVVGMRIIGECHKKVGSIHFIDLKFMIYDKATTPLMDNDDEKEEGKEEGKEEEKEEEKEEGEAE